ncbi:MAG: hypothetical protein P4M15_13045, partial [Alphaproteobacteria bacterium]|nr:hypothetical protein [Alphaproteobacteria bacterium]
LSSYTSKGIITINEARAALGRDPFPDAAANTPMTLTGGGYVALEQAGQSAAVAKFNPHYDERGRFATADGVGGASSRSGNERIATPPHNYTPINFTTRPAPPDNPIQDAVVSCQDLLDSDWETCKALLNLDDPDYHGLCVEQMF